MSQTAPAALIAAARSYEQVLVPALFAEWPPRVIEAAAVGPGMRVLDVACGTGILAREAASQVGADGHVIGVDPGPGMLAVAQELAPDIDWREGIAEALPFDDDSFDAVVSQFGFMFFADKPQAAKEMLRVLKPGGRLAVAVWDTLDRNPAYADEVRLLEHLAGRPAADCVRAPFALGEPTALRAPFGVADIPVDIVTHAGRGRFPTIATMLEADLRGWLPILGVELPESRIQEILEAAEHTMAHYVVPDGTVRFATSAHIVAAEKP
jgi:SAM-dependent methyltransferase